MEQGSPEWLQARCGKTTASRLDALMAQTKTGPAASRKNLIAELVLERLTGTVEEGFTNDAMKHGTEHEPFARAKYEMITGNFVTEVGLVDHPTIPMTGASPDGLVDEDGLIEIKCPSQSTHLQFLRDGKIPNKYQLQMLWQMECTGRKWCDFVSYDPRFPENLQIRIVRFERDEERLQEIRAAVIAANEEVQSIIEELNNA